MKAALVLPLLLRLAAARPVLSGVDGAVVEAAHSPPHTRIKSATPLPVLNGDAQFPINNRPQMPHSSAIPSVVLAEQQPIETTYLLSLRPKGRKKQAVTSAAPVPSEKIESVHGAPAAAQPAERPASQGQQATTTTPTAHPCHHAYAAHQHRFNVAIIFLVALCVIVVVKAESRGSCDGPDGTIVSDSPGGLIRLEIDQLSKKQTLSIQAEQISEQVVAEKGRL
ncbi:hypothetical protein MAPG_10993 [Magnaporthiopsis poae ATCC 64411]|uniref:Uncharacterized protein n=1 Tax=Magnaporthiopsis poae (strain ATCC 64411 / 73-15) TaxID=644358 RepID=A0A0C4EE28_MAGP6|nr:hypothetical protein MAPG_10993 [Magnaporthiopsis poae ATCC 64411]